MRLHSLKLLIAAAIALRTVSSSKEYGFKMAQIDRPTAGPSHADNRTAIHDDRLPQANSATDSEERAPGPSKPVFLFGVELKETTPLFLENALTRQVGSARAHIRPNPVGDRPVSSPSEVTKARVGSHDETMTAVAPKDLEEKEFAEIFSLYPASPTMLRPDAMGRLTKAVKAWNRIHTKSKTVPDVLKHIFKGIANLAPVLAKAKMDGPSSAEFARLQRALLKPYIKEELDPSAVFGKLELQERSLTLENLDTFDAYLELYNLRIAKSPKSTNKMDLMAYLRYQFGDDELIRKVADGRKHTEYPDTIPARLVKTLEGETNSIYDVARILSNAGIDDSTVASLVLSSKDSESKFSLAISTSKLASFSGHDHTIVHLQKGLMELLVRSGKSPDEIYDLLKLSNQVSMGEFLPVARDAFGAYVKAFNKQHPDSLLDADVYLAQKLSAAEALKEPAPKRQRTG
ncbi:unnamed protein product [Hyaloperonospora brassicae]|uniref:RxLR effector candidate protein n=1 Tax=Hyaloperonospora brassicae TaxID=162125 RepID=A0AAV0SV98_HYABA|nr:unnamed protein product [Hyaloperonospora brassicae]